MGALGLFACGITLEGGGPADPEPEPTPKVDGGKVTADAGNDAPAPPPSTSVGNGDRKSVV